MKRIKRDRNGQVEKPHSARRKTETLETRETGKADRSPRRQGKAVKRAEEGQKERIARRRRYIMSGISRKIVSGARTAKMSVRGKGGGAVTGSPGGRVGSQINT